MTFRSGMLAFTVLAAASLPLPALAQDDAREADRSKEIAERLHDPATQLAVAATIAAVSEAVLDMKVEPLVRAMRSAGADPDLPPGATVRDVAGPQADSARDRAVGQVPRAMGRMGDMAGAVGDMLPEFEAMARRVKDAVPRY